MAETLTHAELAALRAPYNLADGHAHQGLTRPQLDIIASLPEIYHQVAAEPQELVQDRFRAAFYTQHGQSHAVAPPAHLLYSASIGIHVAARLAAERHLRVGLITPTFDNIPDLLIAQCIKPVPIEEPSALDPQIWDQQQLSALFLVLPNNPTGWSLDEEQFIELAANAANRNIMLIIDFSFRYFSDLIFDEYALLNSAGCKFIAIEDTGKYISALDMKMGLVAADLETNKHIERIVEDILLNVSPFALELLTRLIMQDDRQETIKTVRQNRAALRSESDKMGIMLNTQMDSLSVEWISAASASPTMTTLLSKWHQRGIDVLPGGPFRWDNQRRGQNFARVALVRPTNTFRRALEAITK